MKYKLNHVTLFLAHSHQFQVLVLYKYRNDVFVNLNSVQVQNDY